jgi:putative tryptophan/tyrosine transport system substrate-binding protein
MRRREFIAGLGSVAAWPLAARAQQTTLPVIGFLDSGTAGVGAPYAAAFRRGLAEHGYLEGGNVAILYRYADNQYDRLPALAEDLVSRRVDVIAAMAARAAPAAKAATKTIPIIFQIGVDPVRVGLVASLNRPGGNITGINLLRAELAPTRLELLHEIVPAVASIGYLSNPTIATAESQRAQIESAARTLGVRLVTATATTPNEIEPAFVMLVNGGIGGLGS